MGVGVGVVVRVGVVEAAVDLGVMHAAVEELGVGLSLTLAIVMDVGVGVVVRVGVVETAVDLGVVHAAVDELGVSLSLTLAIVIGVGVGVEVRVGVVSIRRVSATVEVIVGVGLCHGGSRNAKKDESLHGRYDAVPCCRS